MWDDSSVFRPLWQRIARLFGGGKSKERQVPGGIPAPETLVAKVANVKNKDREILRVAGEAVRRGHPDQAVIAYWKAVQVYLKGGQVLKAVSALKLILQHSPEDLGAFNALADAYEALERKRDAANTCLWIADVHARRGQKAEALAALYRSLELDQGVRGARERINALGGDPPAVAHSPAATGSQARLQSKQDSPAQPRPTSEQVSRPRSQLEPSSSGLPPMQRRAESQLPPIQGIALSVPRGALEEEPLEMPGELAFDDGKIELDIEGDDALDFPDESLVLPVTDAKPSLPPSSQSSNEAASVKGEATIAMAAIDTDADAATVAMRAISGGRDMMNEDLAGDATMLAMEAPPWEGPTDEHAPQMPNTFEEKTDPPVPARSRRFAIPSASTTVDANPPSAMMGSEHDPMRQEPKIGIVGESTRAYSVEELRKLGVKPPSDE